MSGLYNVLFGENDHADLLLACLGLTRGACGRYRDCWIEDGQIVIHTRNGGGNREDYEDVFDALALNPYYVRNEDDDFDCTYANIYFSFPPKYSEALAKMEAEHPTAPASDRWAALLSALQAGQKEADHAQ